MFLLCGRIKIASAQIGIPQINNYDNALYKGGTQNWEIAQDKNGLMYFANNDGLLCYNGKYWHLYPLPNKTRVRSVKIGADGKIYVGAQDEIGFFAPETNGILKYHSFKKLIPANERQFSDVWDIVIQENSVFFRSTSKIFQFIGNKVKIHKPTGAWEFLGSVKKQLFAQDTSKGLLSLQNGVWQLISKRSEFKNITITGILDYGKDSIALSTLKNGMYLLVDGRIEKKRDIDDKVFLRSRIYDAIPLNKGLFAYATNSAGCFIVNKSGQIVQRFGYREGLQKNNIRSVFLDRNQNIWLGLDDGIDFIAFNNAIKYIYPDPLKQTSSYATQVLGNQLYVGTSNGLYHCHLQPDVKDFSYSNQPFSEIANTQGQVWNLNVINKHLMISHADGAFVLKNNVASLLYPYPGTWMFEPLSSKFPATEIIAGTYKGLHYITFENNRFADKGDIKGCSETMRFILYDDKKNTIWASHPYRGIYRFQLSEDKRTIEKTSIYAKDAGLPSALNNYVARIKNKIVVPAENGVYEFDEEKQKFLLSASLTPVLGKTAYQYLNEDKYGNIWFVTDKKVGVVDFGRKNGNKNHTIVYFPELTSKLVSGFENIYPYNEENVFIGSNSGLVHINYQKYLENIKPLNVLLTQVEITGTNERVIFGGHFLKGGSIVSQQSENKVLKLPFEENSLHFEFSSTLYEQLNSIQFSYQLSGFDKKWSEWSDKSEKDYTNLPAGSYTFKVKARNNLGNESSAAPYTLTILPPWYQTWWFYILCGWAIAVLIYLLIQRQKRKHIKEQEYLKKTYQLEIEHNEKEIVKLQNEKLETEVNFKNKELATATMHLMQRGKLLAKIKEELVPIVKTESLNDIPEEFKKVLSLINDSERADADWDSFAIHFDHVHSNFLTKLKEKVPTLSGNDLKLCAYLKMNLSSKEIAQLMSVSNKTVEVSRYRLRKKLEVSSDTNLFDHLIDITS
ncbi:MAG TPA: triple tyrosine motif-containing protein [Pelobium sp.]|nr:triple tyrosine motif-containing protein [Pelobium sp.]